MVHIAILLERSSQTVEIMTSATEANSGRTLRRLNTTAVACVGLALILALFAIGTGAFDRFSDPEGIAEFLEQFGPLAVVVLLSLAVVVSPIPSGPIAMAAGAIYGAAWGGALTAAGAILGALIAFGLSRWLGFRPMSASKLPLAHWITRPRTQAYLAFAVLVSRLIPFISFDAVSYVAGLTPIRMRYFAVSTALGILPASFAFAAIGAGMAEMDSALMLIAACGVTLVFPAVLLIVQRMRQVHQLSGSKT